MADEFVQDQNTEKVVVEGQPVDKAKRDPATDPSTSALPYHTEATEKIQAERAKEIEGKEKEPYKFQFNGYTVTEVEQKNPQATEEKYSNTVWVAKADDVDFEQMFDNKRAAEIFAETHSPQFAKNAAVKNTTAQQDAPQV